MSVLNTDNTKTLGSRINGKKLQLKEVIGGYQLVNHTSWSHSYCFIPEDDMHFQGNGLAAFVYDDYVYRLKYINHSYWELYNVSSRYE